MKNNQWGKKVAVGILCFVGVAHVGALIGHTVKQPVQPVQVSYPPVGEYSSYTVNVNPDGGYSIDYRGHDPTVLEEGSYVDQSNGVFGIGGRRTTTRNTQYISGSRPEGKENARSEECIKAEGGGESNGALVGASIASGLAPAVTGIPYIGWLASGWLVMFGQDMGSSVGGEIASTIKGC